MGNKRGRRWGGGDKNGGPQYSTDRKFINGVRYYGGVLSSTREALYSLPNSKELPAAQVGHSEPSGSQGVG